jgi:class 3 adenylate cyclase/predicted ATPase
VDVGAWLRGLDLGQYEQAFRDNDVDADVLPELTAEDLVALGVASVGHRRKLLTALDALRADGGPPPPRGADADATPSPMAAPATQAERRQLTVMFADLVGSTELSRRLDPEEMALVLQIFREAVAAEIARFEGRVAKLMGDGVLAYFGWPTAHEDEAERAVRAALALTATVGRITTPAGTPLAARVGIATGPVMVGDLVGAEEARERTVVGETPNLAARLQALAEPGCVIVGNGTRRLLGPLFEFVDLGTRELRGFAEPVRAWRVLGEGAAEGRFEALHGGRLTPLIGREHELALLLDRWERAREGDGQVVLLSGEAGIGKSRLVRALRERLGGEPHTPLSQFCSPYYTNTALHPVIGLLERTIGLDRNQPAERQRERLEAVLARATADVAEGIPLLADLLGIPPGGTHPVLDLSPRQKKERTFRVLLDQLAGLAAQVPVLAVYEDVHWADPTTLELIGRVIEAVQRLPVLALVTFRPEFVPPWAGHGHTTALSLSRLARREGGTMVERLTGGRALPAEVLDQILARTDGVPLFVEELTTTVLESGLLSEAGDRYELAGPLSSLAIPATLQDSLMARLDRLAPVKEVAQVAAVIGREFPHDLLAVVGPLGGDALREALGQLEAAGLIFARGAGDGTAYAFKHALVRDAAYHSLLKSRRRELHGRIAAALEDRFPEAAEAQPELLAHHLAEAGQAERAIVHLQRAARRALARSADLEAAEHLRAALRQLDRVSGTERRDALEFELQAALGRALSTVRGFAAPETDRAFARATELGQRLQVGARLFPVLWGRFVALHIAGQLLASHRTAREFVRLARRAGDTGDRLVGERLVGDNAWAFGRLASARRHLERAVALYDPAAHRALALDYVYDQRVVARDLLTCTLFVLGYPEQAEAQVRLAVAEAEALRHRASLAHALAFAGMLAQLRDDAAGVLGPASAVRRLAEEQAIPHWAGLATVLEGWAMGREGSPEAGAAAILRALDALRSIGVRLFRPYHLALLADVEGRAGLCDAASARVGEALREAQERGEWSYGAELHRLRGELALRQGRDASAAELAFRAALELARHQAARAWELRAAVSLARLWADQGERRKAHELLTLTYGWFTEGFGTPDLREARALLDELR